MVIRRTAASSEGTARRTTGDEGSGTAGWRDLLAMAGWHSAAKAFTAPTSRRTAETETRLRRTAE